MNTELSPNEAARFKLCEAVIEKGLQSFVEVGSALLEIRDFKFYQANYKTFEDYCRKRWGWSRQRAYQMIDAVQVANNLSTRVDIPPTSEFQVRPLTQLEPEQQLEAWQLATNDNTKPTAVMVKAAAKKVRQKQVCAPKEREVAPSVIQLWDQGLGLKEMVARTGIHHRTIREIIREETVRRNTKPEITPEMLAMPAQKKVALAIEQQIRKIKAEYDVATTRYLDIMSEKLQTERDEHIRVMKARDGYMTRAEYRKVLSCLHPDWVVDPKQARRYEEAFRIFAKLEKCILDEKESPTVFAPPIPKTRAEWEELKRKATEDRRAKRQAKAGIIRS